MMIMMMMILVFLILCTMAHAHANPFTTVVYAINWIALVLTQSDPLRSNQHDWRRWRIFRTMMNLRRTAGPLFILKLNTISVRNYSRLRVCVCLFVRMLMMPCVFGATHLRSSALACVDACKMHEAWNTVAKIESGVHIFKRLKLPTDGLHLWYNISHLLWTCLWHFSGSVSIQTISKSDD